VLEALVVVPTTSRSVVGTILHLAAGDMPLHITWVVLAAAGVRKREAVSRAAAFLTDVERTTLALDGTTGSDAQ
jgi:hypothetical protein